MPSAALHPARALLALAAAACLFTTAKLPAQVMAERHTFRDLSGTVTDPGHEPLRGAIIQLEADGSHEVLTYITEADGRYHFKRLSGETNYRVWVVFRKRNSKSHEISRFDDHMDKVINFTIEAF